MDMNLLQLLAVQYQPKDRRHLRYDTLDEDWKIKKTA